MIDDADWSVHYLIVDTPELVVWKACADFADRSKISRLV